MTGARVLSNTFVNTPPNAGVWFQQTATDVQIIGNQWLDGANNTGIHFDLIWDMRPHSAITITDNLFRDIASGDGGCCAGINFWGPAAEILGARNVIQDIRATDRGCCHGINFWESAEDVVLLDNEIRDSEPTNRGCCDGINFWYPATRIDIERNRFIRLPKAPPADGLDPCCYGVQFWDVSSQVVGRDNYFDGAWGIYNGFDFWDYAADVTLDGNQLLDNTRWPEGVFGDYGNAIVFWGRLQGFTLTNNTIVGGIGWDDTGMQFWNDISDGIVAGNRLENLIDPGNGIMVWSSAANVTFTHNSLANFGSYPDETCPTLGLILWGDASNVQITHNTLRNFAPQVCDDPDVGIEVRGEGGVTISDNVLENVSSGAVISSHSPAVTTASSSMRMPICQ